MKKLIYLFIVAGMLFSCQNTNKYTITGTIVGDAYEGTNVYLQKMTDKAMVATDSAVVTNGSFTFSGVADSVVLRFITIDESVNQKQASRLPILIEPGKLVVTFDTVITVQGTRINEAYNDFRMSQRDISNEIRNIMELYNSENNAGTMTPERENEISQTFDSLSEKRTELHFNFIKENINNKLGEFVFQNSSSMFSPEQQKEILASASDEFKANESVQRIIKRLQNLENVAIGKKFVDFTLKNPEGKEISLSDYAGKGKYVLIDFWASWCGPCRQEMPNVVAAYKKYASKGFEIVGVSLDKDHDSWTKGIKDLNMTWPQMSDLQYWSSLVVDLYAINGIPHTVLLDKDGIIIEKNLRGEELDAKLAALMP